MSGAEEAVRRVCGDGGCDVTVDAIGNCEVVEAAVKCLKRMGRCESTLKVVVMMLIKMIYINAGPGTCRLDCCPLQLFRAGHQCPCITSLAGKIRTPHCDPKTFNPDAHT